MSVAALFHVLVDAEIYAPEAIGRASLLVCAGKIVQIKKMPETFSKNLINELQAEVTNCQGRTLIPGFIDGHVHITGGGGEAGYSSACPPLPLTEFTAAGVTTVVGLLGTDDCTRSTANLIMRAKALQEEGITAFSYTGGYHVPPTTLHESVKEDIIFCDTCLGCGEIAISDHRSSQPQASEIMRIAADCHVAGLMTRKAGTLHLHTGAGKAGLQFVRDALEHSEIPARVFHPTHVNRSERLFEEAMQLAQRGCSVDVTTFDLWLPAADAVRRYMRDERGLPRERITVSSDAGGSFPTFDDKGNTVGMTFGRCGGLLETVNALVRDSQEGANDALPLDQALLPFTRNWASILRLEGRKGAIAEGMDADLVVLEGNRGSFRIRDVMAMGAWMVRGHSPVVKGTFE